MPPIVLCVSAHMRVELYIKVSLNCYLVKRKIMYLFPLYTNACELNKKKEMKFLICVTSRWTLFYFKTDTIEVKCYM
jgi:hypothetical protein